MARYKVLIKPSAVKEIEGIAKQDRQRIVERIARLAGDPRPPGVQKLPDREQYRVRQGRYRILYSIDDRDLVIRVVKVGHRREVYR